MKSLELIASNENIVATFSEDTIGRNKDIISFIELLNVINESYSIALEGSWGSGKTFFIKQAKMVLDSQNQFFSNISEDDKTLIDLVWNLHNTRRKLELIPQVCVYYDAWENDNDDDPILSLVMNIAQQVNEDFSSNLSENFLKITASILSHFTKKDWSSIANNLIGSSPLDALKYQKGLEAEIKEWLDNLLAERGERLIVFIDELDRCKPEYAVKLLERIKHYFTNERITFVFSVNCKELQHTIKKHYGNEFDACRYLDRFFNLRLELPAVDKKLFYKSIDFNTNYIYDTVCNAVIEKFNFSMRETTRYLQMTKFAAYKPTHRDNSYNFDFSFPDGKGNYFCIQNIVPILLGLKMHNADAYTNFINGTDWTPMKDILVSIDTYYFEGLLSQNETYGKPSEGLSSVTLEQKLQQVYEAVFRTEYSYDNNKVAIGQYIFNENSKNYLLKVCSMFSEFTCFE